MNDRELDKPSHDIEEQALDFLEQWLSSSPAGSQEIERSVETPRSLDPSLRAIERLVSQHRELFRRHSLADDGTQSEEGHRKNRAH